MLPSTSLLHLMGLSELWHNTVGGAGSTLDIELPNLRRDECDGVGIYRNDSNSVETRSSGVCDNVPDVEQGDLCKVYDAGVFHSFYLHMSLTFRVCLLSHVVFNLFMCHHSVSHFKC